MKRLKITSLSIILILSLFFISSCGNNNQQLTIKEVAAKNDAQIGVLNETYQINSHYTYPDGTNIFINFRSIEKQREYMNEKGEKIDNAIIIALDNGQPIKGNNSELESKIGYLKAFLKVIDEKGKSVNIQGIQVQKRGNCYEVILELPPEKNCSFLLISGFDDSSVEKGKLIFALGG